MTKEEKYISSRISRRGFMGTTAAGSLAALIGGEPELVRADSTSRATADAVIVLWMAGGMAQTETWDPKKYTPFKPGVPTAEEAGIKNYETAAWLALLAPGGTPKPVIDKIYAAMQSAMRQPDVVEQYKKLGAEALAPGPDALGKLIKDDTAKWHKVITTAGIQPM